MTSKQEKHLAVFIHGLWGSYKHMGSLQQMFKKLIDSKEEIICYAPRQNAVFKTFDGIEIIGYRVIVEICQYMKQYREENPKSEIKKISIVGYSLGGLIARFVVGKMFTECREFFQDIEPVMFLTMATPHLGIHFYNPLSIKYKWLLDPVLTFLGSTLIGKSGRELFIMNRSNSILVELSQGEFLDALAKFRWRMVFANVKNDRTVAFYTAFITEYDPFISTNNTLMYKFEQNLPGSDYTNILPRIVDLNQLNKNVKLIPGKSKKSKVTLKTVLQTIGLIFLGLFIVLPIALIFNICGTLYSHLATLKYQKMIANGQISIVVREKIGLTEQLRSYVSETYESIINTEDTNDNEDITDTIKLENKRSSKSIAEESQIFQEFLSKYSNITKDDQNWTHEFEPLPLDNNRRTILNNLSKLNWIRVPIYVKARNAHGGIVARQGINDTMAPTSLASVEFVSKLSNYLISHEDANIY
ncbi:hypothetical protein KAFR_0K01290 [Kazachstania africana CBS 2517]|uniref:DUF676 domain-containing protein n=1 Tax=Kazachstania africana (strain ATCC 22294 / BCRC 22015 / CBS 2517 / CECT 1963 / NBRC 1671 / NRRL Y-8276) TaxID=1071382 RepID=H2B1I3_KAZAF|nr:hypothetical protein KAFR_0K01290 [Kazachstania africana CBS 2517]CCF60483.1 hypothetical protein KAFR_0K01290 [Kazachstania africana CBS 2517]